MGARALNRALGLAAAALTGVQVGAATVATRPLLDVMGPASIAAGRYAIGLAVLVPLVMRAAPVAIAPRDRLPVLALGIGQFGLLILLYNAALVTLPARLGALVFSVFPVLTLLLAAAVARARPSARALAGAALCVAALALALDPSGEATLAGALLMLGAAATGAVCSVAYRPYLARYPTLAIGWRAMAAAAAALVPLALWEGAASALPRLDAGHWALLAFVGTASGAGYLLWLSALRLAPPGEATTLLALSPLAALALDWALLGEAPRAATLLALPLLAAGLALALARPRPGR